MTRHPLSQKFHEVLREMGALHDRKQADYGRSDDPFANVRASEDFGIPGWVGALIRMNDKMRRLQAAARGQNLKNESIQDSFLDLAVYAVIGLLLYEQENAVPKSNAYCAELTVSELADKMNREIARIRDAKWARGFR